MKIMRCDILFATIVYISTVKCNERIENEIFVGNAGKANENDVEIKQEASDISKIVGGTVVTDRKKFAYQVSLHSILMRNHFCGGSILDPSHIITAAHCVWDILPYQIQVIAGHLKLAASDRVAVNVSDIFVHENFSTETLDNDIAILKLSSNLIFNDNIKSINVTTTRTRDNELCTVSGWGVQQENSTQASEDLREANVYIISNMLCKAEYVGSVGDDAITSNMICASAPGKDSCQGDSGGPLVSNNILVGLVSWGLGCARPALSGVYTELSRYNSWIDLQLSYDIEPTSIPTTTFEPEVTTSNETTFMGNNSTLIIIVVALVQVFAIITMLLIFM